MGGWVFRLDYDVGEDLISLHRTNNIIIIIIEQFYIMSLSNSITQLLYIIHIVGFLKILGVFRILSQECEHN